MPYLGLFILPGFIVDLKQLPGELIDLNRLGEDIPKELLIVGHFMGQFVQDRLQTNRLFVLSSWQ